VRRKTALAQAVNTIDCTITVKGNRAFLTGTYPLALVKEVTSYYAEGYQFAPQYNKRIYDAVLGQWRRIWDGRVHLFDAGTRSMPAGLVRTVTRELYEALPSARINYINERAAAEPAAANDVTGFTLEGIDFGAGKFEYQILAAQAALKARQCILKLATNAGKTEVACALAKYLKLPTLFVVPGVDLLHQTRARFAKRLGLPLDDIGIIGDDNLQIGSWITVATVDSLYARMGDNKDVQHLMWDVVQLLFVDECHTAGSETFYDVLDKINAFYRIGLSGTPLDRHDGADLRLIAQTGDVAYEVTNKMLIDCGVSVPVDVELKKITAPRVYAAKNYKLVQRQCVIENEQILDDILTWVPQKVNDGLQVLVLVKETEHGKKLEAHLRSILTTPKVKFLHGQLPTQERRDGIADFTAGKVRVIIGTSIMYQGIDTPAIDAILFADIGKSKIAALQAIGRGLRQRPGKTRLLVRDYANFCHKWLTTHSLKRMQIFKNEKCFGQSVIV
jgi:superfamily II DNA or RNA helicase